MNNSQEFICYFDKSKPEPIFRDCIEDETGQFVCHLDRLSLSNGTCGRWMLIFIFFNLIFESTIALFVSYAYSMRLNVFIDEQN